MHIKICGITNYEDALLVAQHNVDYLGFIFYQASSSYIFPERCREIVAKLRENLEKPPNMVGVFLGHPLPEVQQISKECALDTVQLHGNEAGDYAQALELPIIRVFRIAPEESEDSIPQLQNIMHEWQTKVPESIFLLDTYKEALGGAGGTGATFNWDIAAALAPQFPIMLSGGLNPSNINNAIAKVRPWGIDAKSGVEQRPGKKDPEKVAAFCAVN